MIAAMLLMPECTTQAARSALTVWGLDVVPSLFPYMVFCRMLAEQFKKSSMPAAPAAAILGLMGGSPSGASVIAAYGSDLSRRELLCLAALTGTVSPMFLRNTVNTWVRDARFCRLLLISHLLGAAFALAVVFLCTQKSGSKKKPLPPSAVQSGSVNPIVQCVDGILGVGGCIMFFSVLAAGIGAMMPAASPGPTALLHAVLEVAGGLHALTGAPFSPELRAILVAGASGFSGLSILTQNLLFLRPLGLSMRHLTALAVVRALGAAGAMALLQML